MFNSYFGRIGMVTFGLAMGLVFTIVPVDSRAQGVAVLEEIVVTARRREENLQEVPVAVSALSAEDIEIRSIENIRDLQMLLPNVDIRGTGGPGGNAGAFTIRGIPGVARYIDDVVQSGSADALQNVVELERIEVLRGPQGTYFGKNAISGAVQYVTQKPQEEFGARIKTTFGEYNRTDIVANVDIPLSDTVLTKITAASLKRDGYVDSLHVDESYGDIDNTVLRGMLQWQPNDSFTALLTATYNNNDAGMQANVLWDVVENFPVPWGMAPWSCGGGPECYNSAGLELTDELYAHGRREQYLSGSAFDGDGYDSTNETFTANLSWDINDSLTFRSITSTREQDWSVFFDRDSTPFVFFELWDYQVREETTQEFQFLGSSDRLSWVLGVYYHDLEELNKDQIWETWDRPGSVNCPRIRTCPRYRHAENLIATEDTAIFAEVVFDLTEQLSLTVGARYSEEDFHSEVYCGINGNPRDVLPCVGGEGVRDPQQGTRYFGQIPQRHVQGGAPLVFDASFDAFTPRLALQYQFSDNVMGYITGAEGFNGGGVNSLFNPELPNNGIVSYDPEYLTNYELGLRSDFANNRLRFNATYFWGTWAGIQVGEVLTPGQATTTNAGEAEISGIEIESVWRPTDSFLVNFTLATLDAGYTDTGLATTIQVGDKFQNAPETGYSIGLQWDNNLSSGGSVMVRADYGWIDDVVTFRDRRFHWPSRANVAYGLASGRITWTPAVGNWDVAFFGTNLTNEYYRQGGFPAVLAGIDQGVVGRPREFGVTLRMRLE